MVGSVGEAYTCDMPARVSAGVDSEDQILTADEFLAWLEPGTLADLIDGTIRMHSPVSLRHARLLSFVDRLVRSYVEELRSSRSSQTAKRQSSRKR